MLCMKHPRKVCRRKIRNPKLEIRDKFEDGKVGTSEAEGTTKNTKGTKGRGRNHGDTEARRHGVGNCVNSCPQIATGRQGAQFADTNSRTVEGGGVRIWSPPSGSPGSRAVASGFLEFSVRVRDLKGEKGCSDSTPTPCKQSAQWRDDLVVSPLRGTLYPALRASVTLWFTSPVSRPAALHVKHAEALSPENPKSEARNPRQIRNGKSNPTALWRPRAWRARLRWRLDSCP